MSSIQPEVFPRSSSDENSKFSAASTAGKRNASVCVLSSHFRCGANPFSMRNRQRYVSNKSRRNEIRNLRIAYQNSIYSGVGSGFRGDTRRCTRKIPAILICKVPPLYLHWTIKKKKIPSRRAQNLLDVFARQDTRLKASLKPQLDIFQSFRLQQSTREAGSNSNSVISIPFPRQRLIPTVRISEINKLEYFR